MGSCALKVETSKAIQVLKIERPATGAAVLSTM